MTNTELLKKAMTKTTSTTPTKSNFLSDKIITLLNYRINQEEESSRIYKSMSIWLDDKAYFNASKLWDKYSGEELKHADWAREHLLSFNIRPETQPIKEVPNDFSGLDDIIRKTLEHETMITNQCKDLAKAAQDEGDTLTYTLAHKYCAEQVEELKRSYDTLNLLDTYGTEKLALALLDHELAGYL